MPFSYVKPRCGKYEEYGINPGWMIGEVTQNITRKWNLPWLGHFQERRESWHSRNSMVEGQLQKALQNSSTFEGLWNWRVGGSLVIFLGKNGDKWWVARWMTNCRVQVWDFGLQEKILDWLVSNSQKLEVQWLEGSSGKLWLVLFLRCVYHHECDI